MKRLRIVLATVFFAGITLMFLDITGVVHLWLGWMAKMQFLPAVLAGNFVIVAALLVVTLLVGRVYCSVICPLGVMQDICSWFGGRKRKLRFHYVKDRPWLRGGVLAVFVALMILGLNSIAILIAPYSAYGRIATNLLQPVWLWGNNLCAWVAERFECYGFYHIDVWVKSGVSLVVAAVTLVVIGALSYRYGRAWCNNICPVGTVLGLVSRFSLLRPEIDESKCVGCKLCAKKCKGQCINPEEHKIDYSRCVACMDCLENCKQGAIRLKLRGSKSEKPQTIDTERRKFMTVTAAVGATMAVEAQEMKVDGAVAVIEQKKVPNRNTPLKPAGAQSLKNFEDHCTGCQLCVSECPNNVLRPSKDFSTLLQPEMHYDRGYCRPECTRCSEVCPTGAIRKVTREEKTDIRIGCAVWVRENCLMPTGKACGKCQQGCPAGAILLVDDPATGHKIPSVNESRCIGCGKCEYLCPVRPFSAIYVEGREVHER